MPTLDNFVGALNHPGGMHGRPLLIRVDAVNDGFAVDTFFDLRVAVPSDVVAGDILSVKLDADGYRFLERNPPPISQRVSVFGRVHNVREQKQRSFVVVKLGAEEITVVVEGAKAASLVLSATQRVRSGHWVAVTGVLVPKFGRRSQNLPLEIQVASENDSVSVLAANEVQERLFAVAGDAPEILSGIDSIASGELAIRHPLMGDILLLGSEVLHGFDRHFSSRGFVRFSATTFLAGNAEGGARPFELAGYSIQLAQSPQLEKEMLAMALGNVYTVTAAFRNDPSNTRVHLPEFTSLDAEMVFHDAASRPLDGVTGELEGFLSYVTQRADELMKRSRLGLTVRTVTDRVPRISFVDAKRIIRDEVRSVLSGDLTLESDSPIERAKAAISDGGDSFRAVIVHIGADNEMDLSTQEERIISDYVLRTERVPAVFVTGYPRVIKPFYTQPNGDSTESFDLLYNGREIASGGQRVNDPKVLREQLQLKRLIVDGQVPASLAQYVRAIESGAVPHGGFGLGYERLLNRLCAGVPHVSQIRPFVPYPIDQYVQPRRQ